MAKVKILFCTDGIFPFSIGGMQRHSRLLVEELSRNERVKIAVVHPHKTSVFNNPDIEEIVVEPIDDKKNYLKECYNYSKRVYEIIKEREDYIVYSQGLSVWYKIKYVKNMLIVNPHGLEPYQAIGFKNVFLGIPFRLVFNYIFRHASLVVSLGGKLTGILRNNIKDQNKIVELPNAVYCSAGVDLPENKIRLPLKILFVGRFAHNKGIHILFEAIEILEKKGVLDNYQFNLVGKGPLLYHYEKINRFKNVNILGPLEDNEIEKLYRSSDVFVLPTLFEGMPTVILEAMSHSLPVISTDVGAVSVLVGEENGQLIKPSSADQLVKAIFYISDLDYGTRVEMGRKSYSKVCENFTWSRVADLHFQLFQKTLS